MIARIESHRNRPPLREACILFHRLEAVTAAWEHAKALAAYPTADALLDQRNALVREIAARLTGGAK